MKFNPNKKIKFHKAKFLAPTKTESFLYIFSTYTLTRVKRERVYVGSTSMNFLGPHIIYVYICWHLEEMEENEVLSAIMRFRA